MNFSQMILTMQQFWQSKGCGILQGYDCEVGAATYHPSMFFASGNFQYVQKCKRPQDGRAGKHPNRLFTHHQMQVVFDTYQENIEIWVHDLFELLGIANQDIKILEDNWKNPSLGASGLGYEYRCNEIEVLQFTYFQRLCGKDSFKLELAYGLERLAMAVQGKTNVMDLVWSSGDTENCTMASGDKEQRFDSDANSVKIADSNTRVSGQFDRVVSNVEQTASTTRLDQPNNTHSLEQIDSCIASSERSNHAPRSEQIDSTLCPEQSNNTTDLEHTDSGTDVKQSDNTLSSERSNHAPRPEQADATDKLSQSDSGMERCEMSSALSLVTEAECNVGSRDSRVCHESSRQQQSSQPAYEDLHTQDKPQTNQLTYGDLYMQDEIDNTDAIATYRHQDLKDLFEIHRKYADIGPTIARYNNVCKMSHVFNLLDAAGYLSHSQKAQYIRTIQHSLSNVLSKS